MKTLALTLAATFMLVACGQQDAETSSEVSAAAAARIQVKDQDAKVFIEIFKRAGIQEQSSIETTFLNVADAFCIKACQFSVGGGLFVRANAADSETFIKLIRKLGAVSTPVANGRRWDLKDFECSTRFDLASRRLVSSCSFRQ